jgi:hypothetical protein
MKLSVKDLPLRANPAYELVLYDRLSPAEQRALAPLGDDPECYGILRPRQASGLSIKSISQDTALFLFSLQNSGSLPGYARRKLGDDCEEVIARMILDGILEVEADGETLSGPGAATLLFGDCHLSTNPVSPGHLAAISRRALEYGAALPLTEPSSLSSRLYAYNTVPHSRRWQNLLPDAAACEAYLNFSPGIFRYWQRLPDAPAWISWRARDPANQPDHETTATYKLYISPACSHLRDTVEATANAAADAGAFHWKIGKDRPGLLRPDKLVVYFRNYSALQLVAAKIATALAGVPSQGVPFTAELDGEGLLSWGMDPPVERHSVPWLQRESWRLRICNRLAVALLQASKSEASELSSVQFALERLRLEGVDTDTWIPIQNKVWSN